MNDQPLIIERIYNAPVELVWRAITEKELMQKWLFNILEFEPKVGFQFQFEGGEEDKRYLHLCEVMEVEINKKLTYSWEYDGYEGRSYVTFELIEMGEKTKVILTHSGIETFTHEDFKKENFEGGWNYLINESLYELLEKGKALRYW